MSIFSVKGWTPKIHPSAYVAEGVHIIGDVSVGEDVGIWFNTIVRADVAPISIGKGTNIQDNSLIHVDESHPTHIGEYVTLGHGATVHGATIGDVVLVGVNAVVLSGAVVGTGSIIAAGAVVLEGQIVPPGSFVAGIPGKVIKQVSEEQLDRIRRSAAMYVDRLREYKTTARRVEP